MWLRSTLHRRSVAKYSEGRDRSLTGHDTATSHTGDSSSSYECLHGRGKSCRVIFHCHGYARVNVVNTDAYHRVVFQTLEESNPEVAHVDRIQGRK